MENNMLSVQSGMNYGLAFGASRRRTERQLTPEELEAKNIVKIAENFLNRKKNWKIWLKARTLNFLNLHKK